MTLRLTTLLLAGLTLTAQSVYIVEGNRDISRAVVQQAGGTVIEHPDLLPTHTLARLDAAQVRSVARTSHIFRAGVDLAAGRRVIACPVQLQPTGGPSQLTFTYGDGWDGPGLGAVTLQYVFGNTSTYGGLTSDQIRTEVLAQLAKWSSVAAVDFVPGTDPMADRTLAISWVTGDHGDGWPLDPGGALAHAYYPGSMYYNTPIAGDVHFNSNYTWQRLWSWSATDISVDHAALHETGHALGLTHSETAGTVMWPYYTTNVPVPMEIQPGDIESIRSLYAYRDAPVPPPPPPSGGRDGRSGSGALTLAPNSTPTSVETASVAITGSLTGGTDPYTLTWTTDMGNNGSGAVNIFYTSNGPYVTFSATAGLAVGTNVITLTGRDVNGGTGSTTVTVTRTAGGRETR